MVDIDLIWYEYYDYDMVWNLVGALGISERCGLALEHRSRFRYEGHVYSDTQQSTGLRASTWVSCTLLQVNS